MQSVYLYGFGSYFSFDKLCINDIDLLIIHENISEASCSRAIKCKKHLIKKIDRADITILSKIEEQRLRFIEKSNAIPIGTIDCNNAAESIEEIVNLLGIED